MNYQYTVSTWIKGCDIMTIKKKSIVTKLNNYDRKILNKYTRFYTNMIESNTASAPQLENQLLDGK